MQEFLEYKNFVCQEDIVGGQFFYTKQKSANEFAQSDFSSYVPYLTNQQIQRLIYSFLV